MIYVFFFFFIINSRPAADRLGQEGQQVSVVAAPAPRHRLFDAISAGIFPETSTLITFTADIQFAVPGHSHGNAGILDRATKLTMMKTDSRL